MRKRNVILGSVVAAACVGGGIISVTSGAFAGSPMGIWHPAMGVHKFDPDGPTEMMDRDKAPLAPASSVSPSTDATPDPSESPSSSESPSEEASSTADPSETESETPGDASKSPAATESASADPAPSTATVDPSQGGSTTADPEPTGSATSSSRPAVPVTSATRSAPATHTPSAKVVHRRHSVVRGHNNRGNTNDDTNGYRDRSRSMRDESGLVRVRGNSRSDNSGVSHRGVSDTGGADSHGGNYHASTRTLPHTGA